MGEPRARRAGQREPAHGPVPPAVGGGA
jgi:hypothetical protein